MTASAPDAAPRAVPDGVLVVDKPAGMTSHDVVAAVRRLVGARPGRRGRGRGPKVGHAGTLDPDATGVLLVCLGRATRLVPFLQAAAKTYEARMRLGVETTTLDAAGEVVAEHDASGVDENQLCDTLQSFVGEIQQVPPMVSAVRVGGERLHAKARRGEEVPRAPRTVHVHHIVLEEFVPGPHGEAAFLVTCSSGTYVRSLAADVGARLRVGACLVGLRRLASGRFSVSDATDLDALAALAGAGRLAHVVVPPAEALADFPRVVVDRPTARSVAEGRPLPPTGHDGPVAVLDAGGRLLALVRDDDGAARPLVVLAGGSSAA